MSECMLNLKNSNSSFYFFEYVDIIANQIQAIKDEAKSKLVDGVYSVGDQEKTEIGRGMSYAVFPELEEIVKNQEKITIESFRESLVTRGITDNSFQNKLIFMMIQQKGALHFFLGGILNFLIDKYNEINNHDNAFCYDKHKIQIEVIDKDRVNFYYKQIIMKVDNVSSERTPAFRLETDVTISLNKTVINKFNIYKISDRREVDNIYNYLYANQQNILMRIINFIKELFGFGMELIVEETLSNDLLWSDDELQSPSKKRGLKF